MSDSDSSSGSELRYNEKIEPVSQEDLNRAYQTVLKVLGEKLVASNAEDYEHYKSVKYGTLYFKTGLQELLLKRIKALSEASKCLHKERDIRSQGTREIDNATKKIEELKKKHEDALDAFRLSERPKGVKVLEGRIIELKKEESRRKEERKRPGYEERYLER